MVVSSCVLQVGVTCVTCVTGALAVTGNVRLSLRALARVNLHKYHAPAGCRTCVLGVQGWLQAAKAQEYLSIGARPDNLVQPCQGKAIHECRLIVHATMHYEFPIELLEFLEHVTCRPVPDVATIVQGFTGCWHECELLRVHAGQEFQITRAECASVIYGVIHSVSGIRGVHDYRSSPSRLALVLGFATTLSPGSGCCAVFQIASARMYAKCEV